MSTKKNAKSTEDLQAALQSLITKGRKDGMIRSNDLNAILEKMDLTPEKIDEIYDRLESMNIQVVSNETDLDLGDDLDLVLTDDLGDDIDLSGMDEEELVDPVELSAEYNLDDPFACT
jgi:RNA polymerase primary sigma factor